MPRPVEALPCGSRSITSTCRPTAAKPVARLIAVVVLPTPPFWLAMAMTRAFRPASLTLTVRPSQAQDGAARVRAARQPVDLKFPTFRGVGQFNAYMLSLRKQKNRVRTRQMLRPGQQLGQRRQRP